MVWWAWMVLGVTLVIIELVIMDAAFYLIFVGLAAVLVGVVALFFPDASAAGMVALFGVLSLVLMVGFRRRLYERMKAQMVGFNGTPIGVFIRIEKDIPPGGDARVEYRGSQWAAQNVTDEVLLAGTRVEVRALNGTTLLIGSPAGPAPQSGIEEKR